MRQRKQVVQAAECVACGDDFKMKVGAQLSYPSYETKLCKKCKKERNRLLKTVEQVPGFHTDRQKK